MNTLLEHSKSQSTKNRFFRNLIDPSSTFYDLIMMEKPEFDFQSQIRDKLYHSGNTF